MSGVTASPNRKGTMRTIHTALLGVIAVIMLFAPTAQADGFTYFACQDPNGQWNGVTTGLEWSGRGIGASQDVDCTGSGDGLRLHLSDQSVYPEEAQSRIDFVANADTRVESFSMYRETRGLGKCTASTAPCQTSQDLLNYQALVDGRLVDTCSPFAPGVTGTGQCNSGLAGTWTASQLSAQRVAVNVTCGYKGSGGCARHPAAAPSVLVRWIRLGLKDLANPSVSSTTGTLADSARHQGVEGLSFNVTDRGAGVYRGLVEIDGKPVYDQVIDQNVVGGRPRCKDVLPDDSDPYQFTDPVPCKLSASATVAFDTRTVTDGHHDLRVVVEDASGNRTTVVGPQRFTVDNVPSRDDPACRNGVDDDLDGLVDAADGGCTGGEDSDEAPLPTMPSGPPTQPAPAPGQPGPQSQTPQVAQVIPGPHSGASSTIPPTGRGVPNGDRPADDARLTAAFSPSDSALLTTGFGTRAVVRGKLVDGRGAPIANARVELLSRNANPGSALVDKGGARTRADGTWTTILPRDASSRTLSFRYRSHLGDVKPVAEVALTLRVRAGVALTVTPKNASSRGSIRISGRLLGGPLPARGKLVELQARGKGGGRWITFRTVRSDARGRYNTRYRFRNTVGPVTYVFRARAREEAAYPFLTGASRVVSVRVR